VGDGSQAVVRHGADLGQLRRAAQGLVDGENQQHSQAARDHDRWAGNSSTRVFAFGQGVHSNSRDTRCLGASHHPLGTLCVLYVFV
jgi:hypothetical protein